MARAAAVPEARAATTSAPPMPARRADVEWLRILGILLVFTLHAAEPFNPWDAWHVVSPVQSKWLGELAFFLAPWIMPLFMLLAGESAWYALERRTARTYVRERILRLGLPLVAGILVLVPPQVWLERRLRGQFDGSFLAFYPHFFEGIYPQGNFSWHHLWFLVFLLAFALVTLPLFLWLRTPEGRRTMARLAAPCTGPAGLAWIVLPAVAVRLALELVLAGFAPIAYDWSSRGLLLPAFIAGFALAGEPALREAVDRQWRTALSLALASSAALGVWAWPGHVLDRLPAPRSLAGTLLWGGYAAAAWCWLVALRGGARRHLAGARTPALVRTSALVYPFYVLHHPVIVAAAVAVVVRGPRLPASFAAVWGVSLVVTVALCAVVDASGPLRVLFGLGRRAKR
ncbi:acyltransferase family protein [Anaeromyxobacter oryzae]|uniref:Acyltransferase 3 domain-containing protein n=1 Tax=Anaeromyxobacter oryzae TaxID=2918170 RepID=A0ABN6MR62_9BACT|nr:acyltransferase family protein [Anaeromyxobacter oryzae]BDG02208.1 hypothetical protein AMOR_12040 [Anaeromyxobacter oryzae]